MFAVYAEEPNFEDPLLALIVGERAEPVAPEGWTRVKVSHASLNRHDIFTLMGRSAHPEPIPFPITLGCDGAGSLDDGTEVAIYPVALTPAKPLALFNARLLGPLVAHTGLLIEGAGVSQILND